LRLQPASLVVAGFEAVIIREATRTATGIVELVLTISLQIELILLELEPSSIVLDDVEEMVDHFGTAAGILRTTTVHVTHGILLEDC
jgi:hypothetical protein